MLYRAICFIVLIWLRNATGTLWLSKLCFKKKFPIGHFTKNLIHLLRTSLAISNQSTSCHVVKTPKHFNKNNIECTYPEKIREITKTIKPSHTTRGSVVPFQQLSTRLYSTHPQLGSHKAC